MYTYQQYQQSAQVLQERLGGFEPEFLLILGSGLGSLAERVENAKRVPYGAIPHMKTSTAPGHAGQFVAGTLAERRVLLMQGRLHVYEGYSAADVAYPVRMASLLGAHSLIVTNAAGGVNTDFKVGEPMMITDFIKFAWPNALLGENLPEFGERFPDMSYVFTREYQQALRRVAQREKIPLQSGVYYYSTGPQYETPAEIRAIRTLGGDAVGMSTVHEVMTARHCGMKTMGIAMITNMAAGILDQPLTGDEVIAAAQTARPRFERLILGFLAEVE